MVVLVTLFQTAENCYCRSLVRLVDHHLLETALKSLVLLEIFLVFVECGGADRAEFAAGQGRFENVGGIHGTLALTGTHESVDLVNEKNDLAVALGHLVDNGFQAFLEFTLIFGAGDKCAHVERENLLAAEILGYVAAHDALRQSLGNGGFAGTRLADKHRIVLGSTAQNLEPLP